MAEKLTLVIAKKDHDNQPLENPGADSSESDKDRVITKFKK